MEKDLLTSQNSSLIYLAGAIFVMEATLSHISKPYKRK